jgi:hypothetical protein
MRPRMLPSHNYGQVVRPNSIPPNIRQTQRHRPTQQFQFLRASGQPARIDGCLRDACGSGRFGGSRQKSIGT